MTQITGPQMYQALAIKNALKLYEKHKMRVNTAYTPKAMMRTASQITGQTFKARDYKGAIKALESFITQSWVQS